MKKRNRYVLIVSVVVLSLAVLWLVVPRLLEKEPEGLIFASGRVEGDEVVISTRVSGQILELKVDEGDQVQKRDLLSRISSDQIMARLNSAKAEAERAEHQKHQASVDLEFTDRRTAAQVEEARAALGAAEARLANVRFTYAKAAADHERYKALYAEKVISKQKFEGAEASYLSARATVEEAEKNLERAQKGLDLARIGRNAVDLKKKQVLTSEANYQVAIARVAEARANLQDTYIYAPCDGTILTRRAEPGEVVQAGTPLMVMVNLKKLHVKVYIPEPDIGKIRLGNEGRLYVDAFPDRPFKARITRVSQQAEFTPKAVETKEERVKLVFGMELSIENPEGYLKPGMPGDVVIQWKEGTEWVKPH
jgi:HlyD family secretion protein